jgi:hypothetical protein
MNSEEAVSFGVGIKYTALDMVYTAGVLRAELKTRRGQVSGDGATMAGVLRCPVQAATQYTMAW